MKVKTKEKHIIGLIFFMMIIFLFSKNIVVFFRIINDYIVGDLVLTYEDFPNIGEWLQITTTVLFSYLLLSATIKSNKISERSLIIQEQLIEEQKILRKNETMIKLSDLQRGIVFYIGEFKKAKTNLDINAKLGGDIYYDYLGRCIQVIEIHSSKIYEIIPEMKDIDKYIDLRKNISAHEMDLQNTYIEWSTPKDMVDNLAEGLIENLKLLNDVIVNEIKSFPKEQPE